MKRATMIGSATLIALAAATAGCGGGSSNNGSSSGSSQSQTPAAKSSAAAAGGKITVWLMSGSAPDALVSSVDKEFSASHPGVTVDYQVQQWNGIQDKLTTALVSSAPPDVIELGNTQNPKFSADGVLTDLTPKVGELNGQNWLAGLKQPGSWEGKQYGIPFYAGSRVVYYRKDMFAKAGIAKPPTSRVEWLEDIKKLNSAYAGQKDFQSLYLPGQSWYTFLSFLYDDGGDIATKQGDSWKNGLDGPGGQAAVSFYKQLVDTSKTTAPKDADEATPQQSTVVAKGNVAQFIGLPWELGGAVDPKTGNAKLADKFGAFAIPSTHAGSAAPAFVGGSNLAIPSNAKHADLAVDWIKLMTGQKYQEQLAALGTPPNSDAYAAPLDKLPMAAPVRQSVKNGKATPADPKWAGVEAGQNPLKDMLTAVVTGKSTAAAATKTAGQAIEAALNGS